MKSIARAAVTAVAMAGALLIGLNMASASSSPPPPPAVPADTGRVLTPTAVTPQTNPESLFRTVAPCRVVDTRIKGGALANRAARSFFVGGTYGFAPQGGLTGGCGIPAGATAVAAGVTAVTPAGGGYLKAWPAGSAEPNSSIVNYPAHVTTGSGVTLALRGGAGQGLSIRSFGGPTQLIVDVQGYYIPQIQALIGSDASVSTGTARIVSTSHSGTGFYYITLDRPARECSPSAATYNLYRYASVGLSSSTTPNTISVSVWSLDPTSHRETPTDYPFFLTVTC
jgi:hypothetical protein